ncbi:hypothetical protein [Elusimicrobium posterum]|uniref:hypothetical protein n=1 Tax=Elusimicrobium posterum TaxID=3116653 RepID=UPI003C71D78D
MSILFPCCNKILIQKTSIKIAFGIPTSKILTNAKIVMLMLAENFLLRMTALRR